MSDFNTSNTLNALDAISRQQAIDICDKYNGQGFVWTLIRNDISKLPSAQPEPQWIPITERLPEKSGAYLVTTNRHNVYLWYYKTDPVIDWQRLVKAWMPVPVPYQE